MSDTYNSRLEPAPRKRFNGPFSHLVRHAAQRIFRGGERATSDDVDLSVGALLGVLAFPGVFASLFLIDKYGSLFQVLRGDLNFDPYAASLPDEYFFIVVSMVVSAAVAVWKWDTLLPDGRDYRTLAPLPISTRSFLLANLSALVILATILSIDVNAASTILFPVVVASSRSSFAFFARFLVAHFLCVTLANLFGFVVVLGVLGTLMSVLPARMFLRASMYVRFAIVVALMGLVATSFAVSPLINAAGFASQAWLKWTPPVWFIALSQVLLGRSGQNLLSLARLGLIATILATCVAVTTYLLSYRRHFLRSTETLQAQGQGRSVIAQALFGLADWLLLRTAFERAGFRFAFRTLFRVSDPSLALGWFVGLGVVITSQSLFTLARTSPAMPRSLPSADVLGIPLTLSYFLILGLRSAFEIPVSLRANWIFRITVDPDANEPAVLTRKIIWAILAPGLILICLPLYGHFWGSEVALVHTIIVAAMSLILIEISLMRFRKVPFTCSVHSFRSTAIVTILVYVAAFFAFSNLTSTIEQWAFADPVYWIVFLFVFGIAWAALRQWRNNQTYLDRRIIFVDSPPAAVETMNLSFGP